MDHPFPDPGANHASDLPEPREDPLPLHSPRFPLLPSERKPQFRWGFTLWLPLAFVFTPLVAGAFKSIWVFLGILVFGLMAALGLMATKKWRWFGIGLLAGILLYSVFWGLIVWIVVTTLSEN